MRRVNARFRDWVKWTGRTQLDISAELKIRQSAVSGLCRGLQGAGLELAYRIQAATVDWPEGPILAREWIRRGGRK